MAIVLVGIAVAALSSGLATFTNSYRKTLERDVLNNLAQEKLDELVATGEWTTASEGTFEAERYQDFEWSLQTQTTSIEALEHLLLTVTKTGPGGEDSASAEALVYRPAATTIPLEDEGP